MASHIDKGPSGRIRSFRKILTGIVRQDVLDVLPGFSIELVAPYGFSESTRFDLIHENRAYPPKAVLGLAAKRVIGRVLTSDEFSGGKDSECFSILEKLGFKIAEKGESTFQAYRPSGLERFQKYNREQISQIFEPGSVFTAGAGRWGISGVVETPKDSGSFVFMVTLGEPILGNPYEDAITEDGILIWQSQKRHALKSQVIQKLISHNILESNKSNIHLFLRPNDDSPYTYLGLLEYLSHDPESSNPVHFTWRILNWDIVKQDLAGLGLPFRPPLNPTYSDLDSDISEMSLIKAEPPKKVGRKNRKFTEKKGNNIDWQASDERNRLLGLMGEKLVYQYEITQLKAANREDLASLVDHVALYNSCAGFDILSFHIDGTPKRIEVKTTQGPATTPFFISVNEVRESSKNPETYWIYRVYRFDKKSKKGEFFQFNGNVEMHFSLEASNYRASPL